LTIAEYRCTTSAFSGEARFSLGPGDVTHEIGAVRTVLPLAEVASVALAFEPSRADLARHTCTVTGRHGHVIHLQSTSYRGIADFASQADASCSRCTTRSCRAQARCASARACRRRATCSTSAACW
jgi:hypothetical protein